MRPRAAFGRFRYRGASECGQTVAHPVRIYSIQNLPNPLTGSRRWKQRAIHEQRDERKFHITQIQADLAVNDVLKPRLAAIAKEVEAQGPPHFSSLVERYKTNPSPERPPTNAPEQKTYDEMLLALMLQVWEEAKKKGVEKDDPKLGDALVDGLKVHLVRIDEHQEKMRKELAAEEEEMKKKITSEDIHEGFDSKVSDVIRDEFHPCGTRTLVVRIVVTGGIHVPDMESHTPKMASPSCYRGWNMFSATFL